MQMLMPFPTTEQVSLDGAGELAVLSELESQLGSCKSVQPPEQRSLDFFKPDFDTGRRPE